MFLQWMMFGIPSPWGSIKNKYTKAREHKIKIPFYSATKGNATISIKTEKGLLFKTDFT